MLPWLRHGCSGKPKNSNVDVAMVLAWMYAAQRKPRMSCCADTAGDRAGERSSSEQIEVLRKRRAHGAQEPSCLQMGGEAGSRSWMCPKPQNVQHASVTHQESSPITSTIIVVFWLFASPDAKNDGSERYCDSRGCMQGCFDACLDERRVIEMLPAAQTFSGQPFSSLGAARCLNPELEAPCQAPQPRSALVLSVKLTFHLQGNLQYLECSALCASGECGTHMMLVCHGIGCQEFTC